MAVSGVPNARDWCNRIQPLVRVWDLGCLQCLCQAPEALQLLKSNQLYSATDLPVLPALSSSLPSHCGTFPNTALCHVCACAESGVQTNRVWFGTTAIIPPLHGPGAILPALCSLKYMKCC